MAKDPIKLSIISIIVVTLLCILTISKCKPECAVDLDSDKNRKTNWGKTVSISLMIGIVSGILVFVMNMEKVPDIPQDKTEVTMKFSDKVSYAY